MAEVKTNSFSVWDYLVFAVTIAVSMGIGILFAIKGRKRKTQGEYLMASRSMSVIPVAVSIMVSYLSAITILGNPAEMYTQGTQFNITIFGFTCGCIIAAVLFVPLIYPLQLTSVFEYLERRFKSRAVRLVGTWMMILTQIIYLSTTTFAPSTALEAVTGFPVWATLVLITVVGTFYTCVGGMKAVVWTDVFQSVVMVSGVTAVIIEGSKRVGGLSRVWEINDQWGRINFFNFDPDPTVRHAFWPIVIGSTMTWMGTYGFSQPAVQRYSSLPTLRKAQTATMLITFGASFIVILCGLSGITIFAYYVTQDCDILGRGLVKNPNQIAPFFVMEALSYPGVPGLYISALFSGALSSLSSSLNALAAITWEDMLKKRFMKTKLTEAKKLLVIQSLVVVYGALALGMSFVVQNLEGTVLSVTISLLGASGGPLTGLFLLGAFFPWANATGAIGGALISLSLSLWIAVGAFVTGITKEVLPFPNGTCSAYFVNESAVDIMTTTPVTMTTRMFNLTTEHMQSERTGIEKIYSMSYMWYGSFGALMTVMVGLTISFCTGANSIHDVPTKYQIPLFTRFFCCLPESWKKTLQCHRDFEDPEDILAKETGLDMEVKIPDPVNGKMDFDNLAFTPEIKQSEKQDMKDPIVTNGNGNVDERNTKM